MQTRILQKTHQKTKTENLRRRVKVRGKREKEKETKEKVRGRKEEEEVLVKDDRDTGAPREGPAGNSHPACW